VITMAGVLWIISAASFVILVPLAASLLISIYYDYLNARQNFIDTKEETEYRKKSSYLQKISTDLGGSRLGSLRPYAFCCLCSN
ncbi:MAG TPA: hypothetical protein DCZ91_15160, partial [Lachnospiraceae bacterium]|nr:hypothetical protein [Lachnospiraceae bacterium]